MVRVTRCDATRGKDGWIPWINAMDTMVVRGCGWRRTAWRGVEIGDDDDGAMVVLGFCQARARGCGAIGGGVARARWCGAVVRGGARIASRRRRVGVTDAWSRRRRTRNDSAVTDQTMVMAIDRRLKKRLRTRCGLFASTSSSLTFALGKAGIASRRRPRCVWFEANARGLGRKRSSAREPRD